MIAVDWIGVNDDGDDAAEQVYSDSRMESEVAGRQRRHTTRDGYFRLLFYCCPLVIGHQKRTELSGSTCLSPSLCLCVSLCGSALLLPHLLILPCGSSVMIDLLLCRPQVNTPHHVQLLIIFSLFFFFSMIC